MYSYLLLFCFFFGVEDNFKYFFLLYMNVFFSFFRKITDILSGEVINGLKNIAPKVNITHDKIHGRIPERGL